MEAPHLKRFGPELAALALSGWLPQFNPGLSFGPTRKGVR